MFQADPRLSNEPEYIRKRTIKSKLNINKDSKISEIQFRYFSLDLTATNTAQLSGLSRQTVTRLFELLRGKIVDLSKQ